MSFGQDFESRRAGIVYEISGSRCGLGSHFERRKPNRFTSRFASLHTCRIHKNPVLTHSG
jgi:hypothetical protein